MGGVTVASVIVLFFLPLSVIGKAVEVGQPVTDLVKWPRISYPVRYEYMQFVLQVPRTVNPHSSRRYPPLTIHGLWPSNYTNPRVENCNRPSQKNPKLSTLLDRPLEKTLRQFWPNVEIPTKPWRFWSHEYDKHGSCAVHSKLPKFNGPAAYFRVANKLYDRKRVKHLYGLYAGIRSPVHTKTYLKEIQQHANDGHIPGLRCNKTNNDFLQEIVICYDASATNVRNCPFTTENCLQFITFPI